jgi:hypothetical protein
MMGNMITVAIRMTQKMLFVNGLIYLIGIIIPIKICNRGMHYTDQG